MNIFKHTICRFRCNWTGQSQFKCEFAILRRSGRDILLFEFHSELHFCNYERSPVLRECTCSSQDCGCPLSRWPMSSVLRSSVRSCRAKLEAFPFLAFAVCSNYITDYTTRSQIVGSVELISVNYVQRKHGVTRINITDAGRGNLASKYFSPTILSNCLHILGSLNFGWALTILPILCCRARRRSYCVRKTAEIAFLPKFSFSVRYSCKGGRLTPKLAFLGGGQRSLISHHVPFVIPTDH
jgi:hypothetical protein